MKIGRRRVVVYHHEVPLIEELFEQDETSEP